MIFRIILTVVSLNLFVGIALAENEFDLPEVRITVSPSASGLNFHYSLQEEVTDFPFFLQELPARGTSWQVQESDLIIANGSVRSVRDVGFKEFHVHIEPDRQVDTLPRFGVLPLGSDGYLFSTHAVVADPTILYTALCVDIPKGICASEDWQAGYFVTKASGPVDDLTLIQRASVYVGPQEISENRLYHSLIDPRLPNELQALADKEMRRNIEFYKTSFGFELLEIPQLIVSWGGEGDTPRVVSAASVFSTIILHVIGASSHDSAEVEDQLRENITVRMAHHSVQGYFMTRESRTIPWFYWGMFNYMVEKSLKYTTPRELALRYLRPCRNSLQENDLLEMNSACGALIHALADVMLAKGSEGRRDWIWLLNRAKKSTRNYVGFFSDQYFEHLASFDLERRLQGFFDALKAGDGSAGAKLESAIQAFDLQYNTTPPHEGRDD
ncbi:hypothetical protein [Kordiimonas gwangyangensis]|uniref:hypothetical protein n=1 Tax=Kordiimonas gwangyangensis TaxID=288022 RepID=UPI0003A21033|nr:hypothetical protein [Kordiimonas gwangyangensis]